MRRAARLEWSSLKGDFDSWKLCRSFNDGGWGKVKLDCGSGLFDTTNEYIG